jgi:hypothetical protein
MRLLALSRLTAVLLAASALGAPALHAQTVATETGVVHNTRELATSATYGADMAGMRVTAHFADGAVLSTAWGDLGEGVFGASTARFRLAFPAQENTGSPGSYLWRLDNLWSGGLTRLILAGAPGRTVFDVNGEEELTPNSAYGIPLAFEPVGGEEITDSPYARDARVTYRNAVALVGSTPLGDVFEEVDLVFGLALAGGDGVAFDLDTDSLAEGSALEPDVEPTVTPEPASLALVAGGLAAVGLVGARRRRSAA